MNAKLFILTILVGAALSARAGETPSKVGAATSAKLENELNLNTSPLRWDELLTQKSKTPVWQIGNSNHVVSGALVEGLTIKRSTEKRSLGQKILGLPIVRLLVPKAEPLPPKGGGYLRWGESDQPWTAIAEDAASDHSFTKVVAYEPSMNVLSIRW